MRWGIRGGIHCVNIIYEAYMPSVPTNPHPNTKLLPMALGKGQQCLGRGVGILRHPNEHSVVDILDGLEARGDWNVPHFDPGVVCVNQQRGIKSSVLITVAVMFIIHEVMAIDGNVVMEGGRVACKRLIHFP